MLSKPNRSVGLGARRHASPTGKQAMQAAALPPGKGSPREVGCCPFLSRPQPEGSLSPFICTAGTAYSSEILTSAHRLNSDSLPRPCRRPTPRDQGPSLCPPRGPGTRATLTGPPGAYLGASLRPPSSHSGLEDTRSVLLHPRLDLTLNTETTEPEPEASKSQRGQDPQARKQGRTTTPRILCAA